MFSVGCNLISRAGPTYWKGSSEALAVLHLFLERDGPGWKQGYRCTGHCSALLSPVPFQPYFPQSPSAVDICFVLFLLLSLIDAVAIWWGAWATWGSATGELKEAAKLTRVTNPCVLTAYAASTPSEAPFVSVFQVTLLRNELLKNLFWRRYLIQSPVLVPIHRQGGHEGVFTHSCYNVTAFFPMGSLESLLC